MAAPFVARAFLYTAVAAAMMGVSHGGPHTRGPMAALDAPVPVQGAAAHAG